MLGYTALSTGLAVFVSDDAPVPGSSTPAKSASRALSFVCSVGVVATIGGSTPARFWHYVSRLLMRRP
jgi:hypothetical protein